MKEEIKKLRKEIKELKEIISNNFWDAEEDYELIKPKFKNMDEMIKAYNNAEKEFKEREEYFNVKFSLINDLNKEVKKIIEKSKKVAIDGEKETNKLIEKLIKKDKRYKKHLPEMIPMICLVINERCIKKKETKTEKMAKALGNSARNIIEQFVAEVLNRKRENKGKK